jgi:hypothetical protein
VISLDPVIEREAFMRMAFLDMYPGELARNAMWIHMRR